MTRNDTQAQEVVQEAWLRAWRYFDGFSGTVEQTHAWLLTIVRNTFYDSIAAQRALEPLDESSMEAGDWTFNPERLAERADAKRLLEAALNQLPVLYREVLVLRELAECSYQEIAAMTGLPPGTVMSRLARARVMMAMLLTHSSANHTKGKESAKEIKGMAR